MTRTTAREIALQLGFAAAASGDFAQDVLDTFFENQHYSSLAGESPLFEEYPDKRQMRYIRTLVQLASDHRVQLDAYIQKYASGWRVERISKTAAAIMRAAMCEILHMDEVPNAAAINEAVELAKRYEGKDAAAFVNGVLGSFIRSEVETRGPAVPPAAPRRVRFRFRGKCVFRGKCRFKYRGKCRYRGRCKCKRKRLTTFKESTRRSKL